MIVDTQFVEEQEIVDRSTLESWQTCPFQAKAIQDGRAINGSVLASAGQAAHDCYSAAIHDWIGSAGTLDASTIAEGIRTMALHSRPDVQPIVVQSTKYSAWKWSDWLTTIHPDSILRFDGGVDERSGQIAWDVEGVTLTCELDFLTTGRSPEILELYDWKAGWKEWCATDIDASFQFNLYPWLVLQNYDVREVHTRVFNSRAGQFTGYVPFTREDAQKFRCRIIEAIEVKRTHEGSDDPPTWPDPDKCRICPAASFCPSAGAEAVSLDSDPGAYVAELYKLETRVKAMKKAAAAHADLHGTIHGPGGLRFGRDKPASRKPTASIYTQDSDDD